MENNIQVKSKFNFDSKKVSAQTDKGFRNGSKNSVTIKSHNSFVDFLTSKLLVQHQTMFSFYWVTYRQLFNIFPVDFHD